MNVLRDNRLCFEPGNGGKVGNATTWQDGVVMGPIGGPESDRLGAILVMLLPVIAAMGDN